MKHFFNIRPFATIGLLGIPLLFFVIIMEFFFPKSAPEGFNSFIIAFEFAKTPEQIHALLNGLSPQTIRNIDTGNYIDFGFMLTYSLFLIQYFKKGALIFKKRWLITGIPLVLIVLISDITENIHLLKITSIYTPEILDSELTSLLDILHKITWVKWGGLAVIFALYSIRLMGKHIAKTIVGVIFIVPLIISFWALTNFPIGISNFTLSITLAFLFLLLFSFTFKKA